MKREKQLVKTNEEPSFEELLENGFKWQVSDLMENNNHKTYFRGREDEKEKISLSLSLSLIHTQTYTFKHTYTHTHIHTRPTKHYGITKLK